MEQFFVICMKIRNNVTLYLGADESTYNNHKKWFKSRNEAIWFETEKEADDFCKSYFKNFKDYFVQSFMY